MAQSDAASQMYSVVKDEVSKFAHRSKVLMDLLDDVGNAYPFVKRMSTDLDARERYVDMLTHGTGI